MKKQSQKPNVSQTTRLSAKQRKNIRRRERAKVMRQIGSDLVPQNKRWFFESGPFEGFGMESQGFSMGSGSRQSRSLNRMVGVAPKALNIQQQMPRLRSVMKDNGNTVDIITGTDLVATISSGTGGCAAGDILLTQLISPTELPSSRLAQFASLYQRYRFNKIRFVYEPIANATQSGQLVGYADFDVDNELLHDSPTNVFIAVAHQGQSINQIWEHDVFDMGQSGTFTDLYTETSEGDLRLSIQGVFYLIAASVIAADLPLGNIYVDYEVEFTIPFLSQVSTPLNETLTVAMSSLNGEVVDDTPDYFTMTDYTVQYSSGTPGIEQFIPYFNFTDSEIVLPPLYTGQKVVLTAKLYQTSITAEDPAVHVSFNMACDEFPLTDASLWTKHWEDARGADISNLGWANGFSCTYVLEAMADLRSSVNFSGPRLQIRGGSALPNIGVADALGCLITVTVSPVVSSPSTLPNGSESRIRAERLLTAFRRKSKFGKPGNPKPIRKNRPTPLKEEEFIGPPEKVETSAPSTSSDEEDEESEESPTVVVKPVKTLSGKTSPSTRPK